MWIGATQFGPEGVLVGQAAGALLFGIAAIIVCFRVVDRLATRQCAQRDTTPEVARPVPPFASDKAAIAIDWADPEEKVK